MLSTSNTTYQNVVGSDKIWKNIIQSKSNHDAAVLLALDFTFITTNLSIYSKFKTANSPNSTFLWRSCHVRLSSNASHHRPHPGTTHGATDVTSAVGCFQNLMICGVFLQILEPPPSDWTLLWRRPFRSINECRWRGFLCKTSTTFNPFLSNASRTDQDEDSMASTSSESQQTSYVAFCMKMFPLDSYTSPRICYITTSLWNDNLAIKVFCMLVNPPWSIMTIICNTRHDPAKTTHDPADFLHLKPGLCLEWRGH